MGHVTIPFSSFSGLLFLLLPRCRHARAEAWLLRLARAGGWAVELRTPQRAVRLPRQVDPARRLMVGRDGRVQDGTVPGIDGHPGTIEFLG